MYINYWIINVFYIVKLSDEMCFKVVWYEDVDFVIN